jgi:hypothetical protein
MQSKATTVAQYLRELPPERRAAIEAVREVLLASLDPDIEEGMSYGMICYSVPHRIYPPGYHCNPKQALPFAGLASQKHYMSLYLMTVYGEGPHWKLFEKEWARTGKKLDMGKCCLRFRRLEDLALDVIGRVVREVSAADYVRNYEKALAGTAAGRKRTAPARKVARSPARTAGARGKSARKAARGPARKA